MNETLVSPRFPRPKLSPWTLRFRDPDLERGFQLDYFQQTKGQVRVALWVLFAAFLSGGIAFWPGMLPGLIDYIGERTLTIVTIVLLGIDAPAMLVAVLLSYTDWFERWHQPTVAVAFFIALAMSPAGYTQAQLATPLAIQFGHTMHLVGIVMLFTLTRLQFVYAVAIAAIIWVSYTAVLIVYVPGEMWATLGPSFFALMVNGFGALNLYQNEQITRLAYYRQRIIEQQAGEIARAHDRAERLLLNVLPEPIAERLKYSEQTIADHFDDATVLFADIVGFTPLSATMTPHALVAELNRIFSSFDEAVQAAGLEKIKTIGDAYMAAGGILEVRDDHADRVVRVGLELMRRLEAIRAETGLDVDMRVGVHSGPLVAGVIGRHRFIYDLWGDTVNLASRMESHGVPGAVQITDDVRRRLNGDFRIEHRGEIEVKGKGAVAAWLVRPDENSETTQRRRGT